MLKENILISNIAKAHILERLNVLQKSILGDEDVSSSFKNQGIIPEIAWIRKYKSDKVLENSISDWEGWSLIYIPKPKESNTNLHNINGLEIKINPIKDGTEIKGLKVDLINEKLMFEEIK